MLNPYESKTFNQSYETTPLKFHEATSPHFNCNYCFREEDTVLQISPAYKPMRDIFLSTLEEGIQKTLTTKSELATVEVIDDPLLEDELSVFVKLDTFSKDHPMKDFIVTKILTHLHEGLG
tara:strand:- start:2671 stop:3033 length:363 start_codon:yes stop_codon:yes gene_type:complete